MNQIYHGDKKGRGDQQWLQRLRGYYTLHMAQRLPFACFRSLPKVLALLLMTILCAAQENLSQKSPEQAKSTLIFGPIIWGEVTIHATVLDRHRQPARGLFLKDFTLYEDGQRQKITAFVARENEYSFTYKPTNSIRNGGIRTVKIKVHKRGMHVQAPKSYLAHIGEPVTKH
jgi:hypothetical protein